MMREEFDDYFSDNKITVKSSPDKPYISVVAESDEELVQVALDKDTVDKLIEHLQIIRKNM